MREQVEKVKTQDGQEWEFSMPMPESLDEAIETDGKEGVFNTYLAQRKIFLQNIAREKFKKEATRSEVEEAVAQAKPGSGGQKQSLRSRAVNLVMEKSYLMQNDPELKDKVQQDFVAGKFRDVVDALEDLE